MGTSRPRLDREAMFGRWMMTFSVTGQLFLREKGRAADGRRLVMVAGIIAVPDEANIPSEHQVTVAGSMVGDDLMRLAVLMASGHTVDRQVEGNGYTLSALLCLPIWRV
jgi:hypothetical protein